jgi:hypothetical protein
MMYAATIKAMLEISILNIACPVEMDIRPLDIRLISQQINSLMNGTITAAENWSIP